MPGSSSYFAAGVVASNSNNAAGEQSAQRAVIRTLLGGAIASTWPARSNTTAEVRPTSATSGPVQRHPASLSEVATAAGSDAVVLQPATIATASSAATDGRIVLNYKLAAGWFLGGRGSRPDDV